VSDEAGGSGLSDETEGWDYTKDLSEIQKLESLEQEIS
jgi:hypothetical protein